jgi:DNA-binding transcriptional regulator YhcF (GntR family)
MAIYINIMNELAEEIKRGVHRPGTPLPSEEKLRIRFNASRTSVRNALDVLRKEGFIEKRRGSGNFITGGLGSAEKEPFTAKIVVDIHDDQADSTFFSNKSNILKLKGINSVFQGDGKKLEMSMYHRDADDLDREFPSTVESARTGYIDIGNVMSPELESLLHSRGAKIVTIASLLSHVPRHAANIAVLNDPQPGIVEAVKRYLSEGAERLAYVALAENGMKNLRIFETALASVGAGFEYDLVAIHPKDTRNYAREINERATFLHKSLFSEGKPQPDVVFHDGTLLLDALMNIHAESSPETFRKIRWCGVGIPTDAFTGDNAKIADLITFQYERSGETAAKILLKWMRTGERPRTPRCVPAVFKPAPSNDTLK